MREAGQSGGGRRGPEVGPRLDAAERAALGQVGERLVRASTTPSRLPRTAATLAAVAWATLNLPRRSISERSRASWACRSSSTEPWSSARARDARTTPASLPAQHRSWAAATSARTRPPPGSAHAQPSRRVPATSSYEDLINP